MINVSIVRLPQRGHRFPNWHGAALNKSRKTVEDSPRRFSRAPPPCPPPSGVCVRKWMRWSRASAQWRRPLGRGRNRCRWFAFEGGRQREGTGGVGGAFHHTVGTASCTESCWEDTRRHRERSIYLACVLTLSSSRTVASVTPLIAASILSALWETYRLLIYWHTVRDSCLVPNTLTTKTVFLYSISIAHKNTDAKDYCLLGLRF